MITINSKFDELRLQFPEKECHPSHREVIEQIRGATAHLNRPGFAGGSNS